MNTFTNVTLPVILAFVVHKLIDLWRRRKDSRNTPYHFDLKFWFQDNWISLCIYSILVISVILYLEDAVDWAVGFKQTPKQIAELLDKTPTKILALISGYLCAMPISWFEKKTREAKKKLGLMKK